MGDDTTPALSAAICNVVGIFLEGVAETIADDIADDFAVRAHVTDALDFLNICRWDALSIRDRNPDLCQTALAVFDQAEERFRARMVELGVDIASMPLLAEPLARIQ
jgi:hypothetical protein